MSDDQHFRYNCLELAHRLMPGKTDITAQAQIFHDFVTGGERGDDQYVMVDRQIAEQIAAERDDVEYDPKAATLTLKVPKKAEQLAA